MTHEPVLRKAGNVGPAGIFSSEAGRYLLEEQFLIAGVKIRNMCPNLPLAARPLGHMIWSTPSEVVRLEVWLCHRGGLQWRRSTSRKRSLLSCGRLMF
jgi:hypothetical protein